MLATMTDAKTEPTVPAAPRLWTPDGFREDEWTHADSAEALVRQWPFHPAAAGLPRPRSAAAQIGQGAARRAAAAGRPSSTAIADLLDQLSLVALAFPAFSDGRSFSKAELLRSRHHFEGPIRATGQVLIDQLPHMLRLGFSEFEVSHPVLIKRLEAGQTGGVPLYYQPTAKPSEKGQKYSWRRVRDS